jgi:transcription elongation factor GreA-like protein/transcription elongation GreA/GreB family factor
MEYFKQFKKHIDENNLPSTVSLWQEYCQSDEVDPYEMRLILENIKQATFADTFGIYVEEGLDLWKNLAPSSDKNELIKLIFDIQTTNSTMYSELAHTYLKEKYGMIDIFPELLRIVGLRDGEAFKGCIRNFELLIHLQKGNFCLHTGGWGVGEVMDISFLRREISIEFDLVSDLKEISFTNAFHSLTPIPSDHFLARRFGNPEKFEAFTRANPIDAIKLLLKDLGEMTAFEIKEEMADLVIPEEEWTKWWSAVRTKLKKDAEIVYPETLKEPFKLNTKKVTHEDRLKASLSIEPFIAGKIELIYVFLRDFLSLGKDEDLNTYLRAELGEILQNKEVTAAEEIQILFLLGELNDPVAKNVIEIIKTITRPLKIIENIEILAYKRRLLSEIQKNREDWLQIYCDLIVSEDKHNLRDFLYEEIVSKKKERDLQQRILALVERPTNAPAAFVWLFQSVMKGKMNLFSDQESLNKLFEAFFILMHYVEVTLKDRTLTKKMYSMLSEDRFEIVRRIFKGADLATIKELILLSTKCQILSMHDINILHSLAEVVHPEFAHARTGGVEIVEEVIWTTSEGLKKVTDRIEQIATKEVIENAKEIEIARAHGDLRENSEYKFAMEKRARLQGEIKALSAQMKVMKVIDKQAIDTSRVSVGTKVEMKNASGEKIFYIILGPFDADSDKHIISSQTKLAKTLLDKKIGEKVDFNDVSWEILTIESAL